MKIKLAVTPGFIIPIVVTFTIILIAVTALDILLSYKDIYSSKAEEAVSFIRVVQKSGENAYHSTTEVENLITDKLINNGYLISQLETIKRLDTKALNTISESNIISHIYLFSENGKPELKNSNNNYSELNIYDKFPLEIDSIIAGKYDYYVAGNVMDGNNNPHFLILHRRQAKPSGLIALSVESDNLLSFRREIGIGKLFQRIADGKDIEYIVIQDTSGIITASKGVENLSSINSDLFLKNSIENRTITSREISFNNKKILEAVKPFRTGDEISGIIRVGISLESVNDLINRTFFRSLIISLLLLLVGIVVIVFITNNQSYSLLKNEYRKVKSYTEMVLESMSDAVIVTDNIGRINLFNKSAENIFELTAEKVIGKSCSSVIKDTESFIDHTIRIGTPIEYAEVTLQSTGGKSFLLAGSTSIIYNDHNIAEAVIAVFRDITALRNSEDIQKRQEKLTAMGELAAGVAHEIKNPLNLIGITAQRLEKEFIPISDSEEYLELVSTMKMEVQRVSNIINQFLKFARPPAVNKQITDVKEFIQNIFTFFQAAAVNENIVFTFSSEDIEARIDQAQMRQVIINLIQNAFEAINKDGKVCLQALKEDNRLIIKVSDNGTGISKENLSRIFNIYFTTKPNGTGLGLSIVNQIITEHGGTIKVKSSHETGTIFTIELPL